MINRLVRFFRILFAPALTYSQRRAIAKRIRKQRKNLIANPDLIVNPELRRMVVSMGKRCGKTRSLLMGKTAHTIVVDDIKPVAFDPARRLYDDGCEFEYKEVQKWRCPVCGALRYTRPGESVDVVHSIPKTGRLCYTPLQKVAQ